MKEPKKVEFQQRAENGGFPAPNECGFNHGETVYIVSKDYLDALEQAVRELRELKKYYGEREPLE
jgi:hypothetical protein